VSGADVIATDAVFGNATPLMEPTRERAAKTLFLAAAREKDSAGGDGLQRLDTGRAADHAGTRGLGFLGVDSAAALDAERVVDLDGRGRDHDRRSAPGIPDARVLDAVTYNEAAELAYNGAKVLHPRTLAPLVEREIPVWSKNSFAPGQARVRAIVPKIGERRARSARRHFHGATSRWCRSNRRIPC
jgi:bifunctional aspartokinase / homoserine dehydrogenase 1